MMIELRADAGPALVVGGGTVALRKARSLAEGEFRFTVIAPEIRDEMRSLAFASTHERPFQEPDIDAVPCWSLVFACTDDRAVNRRIGELARARNIPVVVTDAQDESTFFTPATIRDGDLAIAVSTGGASPKLAKYIRERIITSLGPSWANVIYRARMEREERLAKKREGLR